MNCLKVILISIFLSVNTMIAQEIIKLWGNKQPEDNGLTGSEIENLDLGHVSNVSDAELWIYRAEKDSNIRKAVLICPGGGYRLLAIAHEGVDFAEWLNSQGITAIVLKYRMPNQHKHIPLNDAREAMSLIRTKATELNIDSNMVGIAGFSAGGHLAATVSTLLSFDKLIRPDFTILYYPVITMGVMANKGSKEMLLGFNPSEDDINTFSCEKQVTVDTPRAILFASSDDRSVPVANSISYYQELLDKGVDVSLHIFPTGGHGWGMKEDFKFRNEMLAILAKWLREL